MNQRPIERHPTGILTLVREGMDVFDSTGERLGSVDEVRFGATADARSEYDPGPAQPAAEDVRENNSIVETIADVFDPDEVPAALAARLRQNGFIRVNGTLFYRNRYILPNQIDDVDDDGVHLNVIREKLITAA